MKVLCLILIVPLNYALWAITPTPQPDRKGPLANTRSPTEMHTENWGAPWGPDHDLTPLSLSSSSLPSKTLGQSVCVSMIRFFQNHISDIDGPRSSFYPTSSQYALEAIEKHGMLKGIALGCDRLLRENKDWWVYDTTSQYGGDRKIDPVR